MVLIGTAYSRLSYSTPLTSYASRSRFARDLPPKLSALAIVLPHRYYATETSTHGPDSGPPPGFNINEAKKPLPKEEGKQSLSSALSAEDLKQSDEQLLVPKSGATSTAKTAAIENASLSDLAAEKATSAQIDKEPSNEVATKKEETKKLTLGQKIKKEVQHYWDGTKLLATEVKISSRLALKMAAGYELSRRENRQVRITPSMAAVSVLTACLVTTNRPRLGSLGAFLGLRHCTVRGTPATCCAKAIPEPPPINLRRAEVPRDQSDSSQRYPQAGLFLPSKYLARNRPPRFRRQRKEGGVH